MRQNLLSLSSALSPLLHLLLFEISVSAFGRAGTLKEEESGPGGAQRLASSPQDLQPGGGVIVEECVSRR